MGRHLFWNRRGMTAIAFGIAAAVTAVGETASAAPITFENGAADYDNSTSIQATGFFRDVQNNANLSTIADSGNTILRHAGAVANVSAATLYDSTPGDTAAATNSTFINEKITVDFRINSSSSSFGVFARLNAAATSGYGMVFNINNSGSNDQIRIFDSTGTDATTGGVSSTILVTDSTITALANGTWYTLVAGFENVSASSVKITAQVYAQGNVGGTALMDFTTTDVTSALTAAGQLGLRFGDNSTTAAVTSDADNFEIGTVPEPGTAGVTTAAGLLSLARRRRRR